MDTAALQIREDILRIAHSSGHGHIPTCFSIVELLLGTYRVMRHRPGEPDWGERDLFILSKGHAALGLYCTLARLGYFPVAEVAGFGAYGSRFGCHPDHTKVPGVEASTGSLGHGIGLAVGMAMALSLSGSGRRIYTLIGDGETNEGAVWEAVMVAAHQGLTNLTILVDNNNSQVRCLPLSRPAEKFAAFGCRVVEIDGHDLDAVRTALAGDQDGVRAVIANTVKGHGCPTLVREMFAWHRRSPDPVELELLLRELHGPEN